MPCHEIVNLIFNAFRETFLATAYYVIYVYFVDTITHYQSIFNRMLIYNSISVYQPFYDTLYDQHFLVEEINEANLWIIAIR